MWLAIKAVDGVLSVETVLIYPLETFGIYGYIPVDVPAWFMLSLFFVRVISRYLIHRSVNPIIIIAVCVSGGFILHLLDNPLPFYVPNILMGIAFFMAGYRFGRHEKNDGCLAFAWSVIWLSSCSGALLWDIIVTSSSQDITCYGRCLPTQAL